MRKYCTNKPRRRMSCQSSHSVFVFLRFITHSQVLGLSFRPTERQTSERRKLMPRFRKRSSSCVRRLIDSSSLFFPFLLFNPVSAEIGLKAFVGCVTRACAMGRVTQRWKRPSAKICTRYPLSSPWLYDSEGRTLHHCSSSGFPCSMR